jgi:hypothetical protein
MGNFQPHTVMQMVDALNDVCRSIQGRTGIPVTDAMKDTLAKWIISQVDNGV